MRSSSDQTSVFWYIFHVAIVSGSLLACLSPSKAQGQSLDIRAQEQSLEIHVAHDGWGNANVENILKVLQSAGNSVVEYVDVYPHIIEVAHHEHTPITLDKRGTNGAMRIRLNVQGTAWAQFAFQFGHEICHAIAVPSGNANPHHWFEEALCEVSSLFVLEAMATTWPTKPPYEQWRQYAGKLRQYRDKRIASTASSSCPKIVSLKDWFNDNRESLSKASIRRKYSEELRDCDFVQMATVLLPTFERSPGCWAALSYLNTADGNSTRTFQQYLQDWSDSAPKKDRRCVRSLSTLFGISISR